MKLLGKVLELLVGLIAFLGMLLLSPWRGFYIIVSSGAKRIIPTSLHSWVNGISWIITGCVFFLGPHMKHFEKISTEWPQKSLLPFVAVFYLIMTFVGLRATILDAIGWMRRLFKSETTEINKSNMV